jgi:hypothetical protein
LIAQAAEDSALAFPVYDVIRDQRVVRVRVEVATLVGIVIDPVAHGPIPLAALTWMPWLLCALGNRPQLWIGLPWITVFSARDGDSPKLKQLPLCRLVNSVAKYFT